MGGEAFGRSLGPEDGAPRSRISGLINESPKSSLVHSALRGLSEKTRVYEPGSRISPDGICWYLHVGRPASGTVIDQ